MKRVRNAFVTGILVLVPVAATFDILLWFVRIVDNNARQFLPSNLPFDFHGLGLLLSLAIIFITGALTQNFVGNWLFTLLDAGIRRAPVVGGIYGGIRKFLETVFNPKSDRFKGVVLVEFPRPGVYSIGFRTGTPDSKIPQDKTGKLVNVFVPCTPNPTSGFYLLIPEQTLIPMDLTVQEAFRIVISMGLVTSDEPSQALKK